MPVSAQLSVPELRRSSRYAIDYPVIGEHRRMGDVHLHISNVSAHGFMANSIATLERGERLVIRFPVVGRIEAHLIWTTVDRTGFQFERVLRTDDFLEMIDKLQPSARPRARR